MRVIIADLEAIYAGRGNTVLPRGIRSIILKHDGSISIHNDESNKPLNYMKKAAFTESEDMFGNKVWTFEARNESLSITIYSLIQEMDHQLMEDDPGLIRDGTEAHLQEWLSLNIEQVLGKGYHFVQREFQTGHGAVDLLLFDKNNVAICAEVKRTALLGVVYQTKRYVDAVKTNPDIPEEYSSYNFEEAYGMIIGIDIRPKTLQFADKHNIQCINVPKDWRSIGKNQIEL